MSGRFEGKRVLISGAARGFGAAAAEAFANEGASLLLTDVLADQLRETADSLGAEFLAGDVSEREFHQTLVAEAQSRLGGLDIAINNAGIAHSPQPIATIDAELAQKVVDIDLMGVFWAMQAQLAHMAKAGSGTIVNLSSVAGIGGAPGLSIYSAAKHGVVGLTKSAAAETARLGIRINAVCPAFAKTQMVEDIVSPEDADGTRKLVRNIPMGRVGEVSEVVSAILWAADPANSFMTGQTIAVDGGLSAV